MSNARGTLEDHVLAVFERACLEQDLAVAEHLLRALELIAQRNGNDNQLQQALLKFAKSRPRDPS
ncbi:hypothetical protein LPB67_15880 [Undibacterium sp. Jales W-56]|uniref:hypothetical protein n=1 Tax=Undibacterium sp. Jales W-56 TaxID=2897325 RepID=UPI0021D21D44|nr:hypothetical protein [Undibacterium sp. Jales W-56]MCU6435255.1 hypothetical protein [Undibacterium sp. Jales W-56]